MEKKFGNDEDLDRLLDEQFLREARILEQAILSNKKEENYQETDEKIRDSYHKLIRRLKAEGIYREDADADGSDRNDAEKAEPDDTGSYDGSSDVKGQEENGERDSFPKGGTDL